MKKQTTMRWAAFSLIFLFLSGSAAAQSLKDFFSSESTNAVWLGIDFTKNKVIDEPTANVSDIRDRQYAGLNDLIEGEAKKYDIRKAFHRINSVDDDLSIVNDRNPKTNGDDIRSSNTSDFHRLKEEDITSLVRGYDFKGKKGIGILMVSEAMGKTEKAIALWVAIIDMSSRKVLFTDRVEGKTAMGFGFRNYWAAGIKNALEEIEKKKYKEWKAKAGA